MRFAHLSILALALTCASSAPAAPPASAAALRELSLLASATAARRAAPVLDVARVTRRLGGGAAPVPTALMHGLGDAGTNAGMQSLAASIPAAWPGAYAVAVSVADGLFSFITPLQEQIDAFAAAVRADATLAAAPAINVVGLSQGGLIVRGYAEQYAGRGGYPAVQNLVSICGVQNGVFNCPLELQIIPFLCDIFESDPYRFLFNGSLPLSFSDYFVTWRNQSLYLAENTLLPPLNNQLAHANASEYKAAMAAVKVVLLSQALNDTVVYPFLSEQFGGYEFSTNSSSAPVTYDFAHGAQRTQNLLGLADRDGSTLILSSFEGDHIRFNDSYWDEVVLPLLH